MLKQEETLRHTAASQGRAVLLCTVNKNKIKAVSGWYLSLEGIPDSCNELPDVPNPLGLGKYPLVSGLDAAPGAGRQHRTTHYFNVRRCFLVFQVESRPQGAANWSREDLLIVFFAIINMGEIPLRS